MLKTAKVAIRNELNDKYLFLKRDNKPNIDCPNMWDVVGGAIEEGEDAITALIREKNEEIGNQFGLYNIRLIKTFDMTANGLDVHTPTKVYAFHGHTSDIREVIPCKEGQYGKYFSIADILKDENLIPTIKDFITYNRDLFE
jgi:ADP-ribose pyrophosphatase YjhB (NUDIX family)